MKIREITEIEPQDVYNMEVEDTHCFLATESDIVCHNCDALRYAVMYLKDKRDVSRAAINVGYW